MTIQHAAVGLTTAVDRLALVHSGVTTSKSSIRRPTVIPLRPLHPSICEDSSVIWSLALYAVLLPTEAVVTSPELEWTQWDDDLTSTQRVYDEKMKCKS